MRATSALRSRLTSLSILGLLALGALIAGPVIAATVDTSGMAIAAGQTMSRSVTNVSGRVSVSTSNKAVASATYSSGDSVSGTVRVTGLAVGTATISVKDGTRKSQSFVVTVTAPVTFTARLMAANCFQCHGSNASGGFKSLASMTAGSIYNQLLRYKGSTSAANIMAAHAMGYSDAQLKAIADYVYLLNH